MRKLNKNHLLKLGIFILSITAIVYVPYGLAYTSLLWKPFSYTPPSQEALQVTPDNATYFTTFPEVIPHFQLILMAWFEGTAKLFSFLVALIIIAVVGYYCYALWDWLYPKQSDG